MIQELLYSVSRVVRRNVSRQVAGSSEKTAHWHGHCLESGFDVDN